MIAIVYSTVETLITFVAYLGSIGTNAEIAAVVISQEIIRDVVL